MNADLSWSDDASLPRHSANGWAVWKGKAIPCIDLSEVNNHLKGWNQTSTILVGAPNSALFLPPTAIAEVKTSLVTAVIRQSHFGVFVLFALSTLFFILAALNIGQNRANLATAIAGISLIAWIDLHWFLRDASCLSERVRYLFWLTHNALPRRGFWVCIVFMSILAIGQLALNATFGYEQAIETYGFVFKSVRDGEFWRVLVGPFFHGSFVHFLNNGFMLMFLGPVLWPSYGYRCLFFLIIGSSVGATAEMLSGNLRFDSMVGISGGVFALFGVAILDGIRSKEVFPRGFTVQLAGICTLSAGASLLLIDNSSVIAHLAGFVAGIAISAMAQVAIGKAV